MDIDLRGRDRIVSANGNIDPGGLLGGVDGGKTGGLGLAEDCGQAAVGAGERRGSADRSGDSADEPFGSDAGGGSVGDRIELRRRVSDGAGDCRGHVPEDGRNGVWVVVRDCPGGRDVISMGCGPDIAEIRSAIWNGGATRRSGGDLRAGMENLEE